MAEKSGFYWSADSNGELALFSLLGQISLCLCPFPRQYESQHPTATLLPRSVVYYLWKKREPWVGTKIHLLVLAWGDFPHEHRSNAECSRSRKDILHCTYITRLLSLQPWSGQSITFNFPLLPVQRERKEMKPPHSLHLLHTHCCPCSFNPHIASLTWCPSKACGLPW